MCGRLRGRCRAHGNGVRGGRGGRVRPGRHGRRSLGQHARGSRHRGGDLGGGRGHELRRRPRRLAAGFVQKADLRLESRAEPAAVLLLVGEEGPDVALEGVAAGGDLLVETGRPGLGLGEKLATLGVCRLEHLLGALLSHAQHLGHLLRDVLLLRRHGGVLPNTFVGLVQESLEFLDGGGDAFQELVNLSGVVSALSRLGELDAPHVGSAQLHGSSRGRRPALYQGGDYVPLL